MEEVYSGINQVQPLSLYSSDDEAAAKLHRETSYLTDMKKFFPELVWNKVLQKIKDPIDIQNCFNSTPFFHKFLKKKREKSIVLPNVFVMLFDYLNDSADEEESNSSDTTDENIEVDEDAEVDNDNNLTNSMKVILKCRGICKSWKNTIDSLFENPKTGHFMLSFEMGDFPLLKFSVDDEYTFHPQYPLQRFQQHFDATHYDFHREKPKENPFIGRIVNFLEINLNNHMQQEEQDYINEIGNILKKYGTEIWYASFQFEVEFGNNSQRFYAMLREFLRMMTNLKVLRLRYNENYGNFQLAGLPIAIVEIGALLLRNVEFEVLNQVVSQNPLSSLVHLQYLDTDGIPTPVFNELITKNSTNINQLQVYRKEFHGDYEIFSRNFPNLTALNLQFCSIADFDKFESCEMPMNLKRFYFWYEEKFPFFPWSRLFRVLENKLGASCEELVIQFPKPKNDDEINQVLVDSHSCRLNLPNLQRLTIFDDMAYCMDFLLPCKMSLKLIVLRYSNDQDSISVANHIENQETRFPAFETNQAIQFLGFKEKMEESNIWGKFAKLRSITIHRNREMGGCITYCGNLAKSGTVHKNVWYRGD